MANDAGDGPLCSRPAPNGPGIEPRWTRGAKDAIGTAYAVSSRVWFTVAQGVVTEVYYPTIDQPQIRDWQFLVSDGASFFHDERRQMTTTIQALAPEALGYRVVNQDPEGRYRITKEVLSDPHQSCVLMSAQFEVLATLPAPLHLYALVAPHLGVGGWGNCIQACRIGGRWMLAAHKDGVWLAMGADVPLQATSCGYVGVNDGWTQLANSYQLQETYDCAGEGNVAGIAELDLSRGGRFTAGLAFGETLHSAANTLLQALDMPFAVTRARFLDQWQRVNEHWINLDRFSGDGGRLYRRSVHFLLAHEDKTYPGAMIASLSIPWGEVKSDSDLGGYHLVWTRDMVKSARGLLAAGHAETPLRALIYLATSQREDGGFYQNFWVDGRPYWTGQQLDEAAFPILLAWRLHLLQALREFDPFDLVMRAAGFLIAFGPVTPEERWEEASGYSPSTLAALIAALTCAAAFARERGEVVTADFTQNYADFLNAHLEGWTVTSPGAEGAEVTPGIGPHYIRILPVASGAVEPEGGKDRAILNLANRAPGKRYAFPAASIVDQGFLELVRYGVRRANDPLIEASVRAVDAVLKVNTPYGPCWRRYNHDGYGQKDDGSAYTGWGRGRAWPLLTAERAQYELAAGRPVDALIQAMERFAHGVGLLPEQIWDAADVPQQFLAFGRPTGSAMPLMWAHSEYVKLLRSRQDGQVYDRIPQVAERYAAGKAPKHPPEFWNFNYPLPRIAPGRTLSVQAPVRFVLHWTADEWRTAGDTPAQPTATGLHFVQLPTARGQRAPLRFTFYWPESRRWEGKDYAVSVG
ncbi:MAG: glycoside hydrolase family 15 protein [Terriglobales bacterium]